MENKAPILYVDDDLSSLAMFDAQYRRYYNVFTAANAELAKMILAKNEIHILITDQRMPGMPGTELLEYAVKNYPAQVRILVSGYADDAALILAMQQGHIIDFVGKPLDFDDLKKRIDYAHSIFLGNMEEARKRVEAEEANRKDENEIKKLLE